MHALLCKAMQPDPFLGFWPTEEALGNAWWESCSDAQLPSLYEPLSLHVKEQ